MKDPSCNVETMSGEIDRLDAAMQKCTMTKTSVVVLKH